MSRRSRRRKAAGETRWLGKAAVGLLVLALAGLAVAYGVLRSYLHSDSFRKFLSATVSKVADVDGEFEPFVWDGLAVGTPSFIATGNGVVAGVRADGLHTEIGLGGVRRGVWEIRGSKVRRLEISVDATRKSGDPAADAEAGKEMKRASAKSPWIPRDAELREIDIGEIVVKAVMGQGLAVAEKMRVHAERVGAKDSYRAEITGGTVRLPFSFIPELRLERASARYQDKHVFLSKALVSAWDSGRIEATGEWDMGLGQYSLEGDARGLKCENIFSPDWAKRFSGDVTAGFALDNFSGQAVAKGDLTIFNGVLTALPMLDMLAAYADTRRFRVLALSEAHTEWRWKSGEISLTKLVLASEGLAKLEGSLTIRGDKLDGRFRLGLAPGMLASIPGAETDVFLPGERGLLWTPLRITGTIEDPEEDLTARLVEAAGWRMFEELPETGEKVIKFTRSVIGDKPGGAVEKGIEIIGQGTKAVQEVKGVLDGILGDTKEGP